jgi:hypothetical protein
MSCLCNARAAVCASDGIIGKECAMIFIPALLEKKIEGRLEARF